MPARMTTLLSPSACQNYSLGFARLCGDNRRLPMTLNYGNSRWKVLKSIFPHCR